MTVDDVWNRAGDAGRFGLLGAAIVVPLARKDFRSAMNALVGVLATSAASKAIKAFWHERRPNGEDNNSFPSQHAAECFAAAVALDRQLKGAAGPLAMGFATFTAFTRVFGRKHHVSDVLAGTALGTIAASWSCTLDGVGSRRSSQ